MNQNRTGQTLLISAVLLAASVAAAVEPPVAEPPVAEPPVAEPPVDGTLLFQTGFEASTELFDQSSGWVDIRGVDRDDFEIWTDRHPKPTTSVFE